MLTQTAYAKAIREFVVEGYGKQELKNPSWSIEALALFLSSLTADEVNPLQKRVAQLEQALGKAINLLLDHDIEEDLPVDISELEAIRNELLTNR